MNGNRMKYASTPTYGMQKRSLFKKPAAAHHAPDAPDFSKAPDSSAAMPFQPSFMQPGTPVQQPISQPAVQQPSMMPNPPYFQQGGSSVPMQQTTQIPFASPAFIPPVSGMPLPPMQTPQAPVQQMPLGNTVPPFQGSNAFSTRSQGFVPPQPTAQPSAPYIQPAGSAPSSYSSVPPFGGMNPGGIPQQSMNYTVPAA